MDYLEEGLIRHLTQTPIGNNVNLHRVPVYHNEHDDSIPNGSDQLFIVYESGLRRYAMAITPFSFGSSIDDAIIEIFEIGDEKPLERKIFFDIYSQDSQLGAVNFFIELLRSEGVLR